MANTQQQPGFGVSFVVFQHCSPAGDVHCEQLCSIISGNPRLLSSLQNAECVLA